jgi:signal transduction histidine kinase
MSKLDFSTVLAIGIHDMKNSLNRVLTAVDALSEAGGAVGARQDDETLAQLQYEARRMKDNLTKLLTIYRNDNGLYQPDFAEVSLYELLEDCWLNNKPLMDMHNIACTIDCDDSLTWTLDRDLVISVIENVLTNTVRYTKSAICLGAWVESAWLWLTIDDDGPGFPAGMLGRRTLHDSVAPDAKLGNTGLGLHFCAMAADRHAAPGGDHGCIELGNQGRLGGGRFVLKLPALG